MSTTMDDNDVTTQEPLSAQLRPNALVYLWAPGVDPGSPERTLARVVRAGAQAIQAVDLTGPGVQNTFDVGPRTPPEQRWTWELAAPAQNPAMCPDVQFLDRDSLSPEERRQLLLGDPGQVLTFHLAGGSSVDGIVTKIVYDGDDPVWLIVASPADARVPYEVPIQVRHIAKIMRMVGRG